MNNNIDIIDSIIRFENGELNESEAVELFAELIRTGKAWTLQGFYGRTARSLIENGIVSEDGTINMEVL